MTAERNFEGAHEVAAGRIEELRRLEAAERALAEALATYFRGRAGGAAQLHLAERYRAHAALLAARIHELGGELDVDSDDVWIMGDPREPKTILYAVQAAQRTYHDHLLDLDPQTMHLVRDRILPDHDAVLAALTGDAGYEAGFSREDG